MVKISKWSKYQELNDELMRVSTLSQLGVKYRGFGGDLSVPLPMRCINKVGTQENLIH